MATNAQLDMDTNGSIKMSSSSDAFGWCAHEHMKQSPNRTQLDKTSKDKDPKRYLMRLGVSMSSCVLHPAASLWTDFKMWRSKPIGAK